MLNIKAIIPIVLILILTSTFLYKTWSEKNIPYDNEYTEKIGFDDYNYNEKITQILGAPIDVKYEEESSDDNQFYYMWMTFDGYKLYFESSEGVKPKNRSDYMLNCAWITSPNYKIGKYNIGIGSDKTLIEKAYKGKKKLKDGRFGFIDGIVWIHFIFDSNDKAKEIVFTIGGA